MKLEVHLPLTKIIIFVCVTVNSLFIVKYGLRILPLAPLVGVVVLYSSLWVLLTYGCRNKNVKKLIADKKINLLLFILILSAIIFLHTYIDPYTLRTDRWSAIDGWGRYLLDGRYPYAAPTHLNGRGSPFPIWQLFHLPFVILGNVGYGFTFSLIIFFAVLWKNKEYAFLCGALVLMCISPVFWYEVAVRSDMFYNVLLLALVMRYRKCYSPYIIAVLTALFCCTRLLCIIPIAIAYLQWYIKECQWKTRILMVLIFAGIVIAVFLPFALWPNNDLLTSDISPLRLQTRAGGIIQLLFCVFLVVTASRIATTNTYYAITAIVIFVFFSFCSVFYYDFIHFDITYIATSIPFAIFALSERYQQSLSSANNNQK